MNSPMYKHQYRIRAPQDVSTQPENICLSISTCCIYVPLTCDKYVLWENISIKYKSEIEKSKYNYSEIWSISYAVSIVDCPAATAAVKSSRDRPAVNTSLSKYVRKVWNKIKWRKHMQSIVIYILFTFFVAPCDTFTIVLQSSGLTITRQMLYSNVSQFIDEYDNCCFYLFL